jgi:hypothetical protein
MNTHAGVDPRILNLGTNSLSGRFTPHEEPPVPIG